MDLGSPASVVEPFVMSSLVLSREYTLEHSKTDIRRDFEIAGVAQGRLDAMKSNRGVARVAGDL